MNRLVDSCVLAPLHARPAQLKVTHGQLHTEQCPATSSVPQPLLICTSSPAGLPQKRINLGLLGLGSSHSLDGETEIVARLF